MLYFGQADYTQPSNRVPRVNRSTGAMVNALSHDPPVLFIGACIKAPFTGLPQAKL
jgi:hypothetical protein